MLPNTFCRSGYLPAFAEGPVRKDGDECEKGIHRSFSVGGFASAGFAEAVKMPRAEARGASLYGAFLWITAARPDCAAAL
jgi:hypothetical protein